jgi:hypothetical protein
VFKGHVAVSDVQRVTWLFLPTPSVGVTLATSARVVKEHKIVVLGIQLRLLNALRVPV